MTRHRRWRLGRVAVAAAGVTVLGGPAALAAGIPHAGPQGDGTAITSYGWRITPSGTQTPLGERPYGTALSPDGTTLLVSNDGQSTQSLQVVDVATRTVRQTIPYSPVPDPVTHQAEALYVGLGWSPDGTQAYASAGGNNKIRVYSVAGGRLTETRDIPLPTGPAGSPSANPFPAGLAVAPGGRRLFVAENLADSLAVVDIPTGKVTTYPVGHNPYGVAISRGKVYVTNQGASTVSVLDLHAQAVVSTLNVHTHPNHITVGPDETVYVANGDDDSVSVIDPRRDVETARIDLAPYRNAPVGSNPDGLAVSPDGSTLFVAAAGENAVDVVPLTGPRAGTMTGMIPTAWYPTAVTVAPDGQSLLVANGKGLGAGPNDQPVYPNPTNPVPASENEYIGSMIIGSLSAIPVPTKAKQLQQYTHQVKLNNGYQTGQASRAGASQVIPHRPGGPSPIKHVIYVVKENRTYDQEFGSLGKGNGDPSLNLFGDESAPNSRALQSRFVTLDNYYAAAEVSADGWNWSTAANANSYVQQTWPADYSARNRPYDFEGGNPATAPNRSPANAYLWDRLADNRVPFRNYGFFKFGPTLNGAPDQVDPRLAAHDDPNYWGYDLSCPDSSGTFTGTSPCTPRIDEWQREFAGYVANGTLPAVELVRLPNDHTRGTTPGAPTARAYVADNDYALGRLVDTVSHSKYWASTAIFVTEDDAQNGPDHVDAHRTIAQVISPYTQTGAVDSTFYSTVSMLRTIELLTGLRPMTQFDAFAMPMANAFAGTPNLAPYEVVKPPQEVLDARNGPDAPMAAQSAALDFSREDRADSTVLNQAVWQSVKGAGAPMPAPRGRSDGDG